MKKKQKNVPENKKKEKNVEKESKRKRASIAKAQNGTTGKEELRRHQRQAKKAQKKIENNLLKKFGLHVSEVEDDDEDDAIHDKICELEAELQILKGKAIENAKAKNS